jgi:HD-GYP domain-containing protein (c-di-GMP phosphodiesterase class II)
MFHDVGKIKIPDSILLKEGKLDPLEITEMMRHPEYGAEILGKASSLVRYIPVVRHHHEWYDGTGYPDGLSRDEIPLSAAITCLVDAFDAMTSDRPYRRALTEEKALEMIQNLSGKQFSPELVKKFVGLFKKIRLKYL